MNWGSWVWLVESRNLEEGGNILTPFWLKLFQQRRQQSETRRASRSHSASITFHVRDIPPCHGINTRLSGRLPSSLVRLTGSFVTGMSAEVPVTARAMTSLIAWCLAVLLVACLHTKPCDPCACAKVPHLQVWAIQTLLKPVSAVRSNRSQKSGHLMRIRDGGLYHSSRRQNAWFIPERLLIGRWSKGDVGPCATCQTVKYESKWLSVVHDEADKICDWRSKVLAADDDDDDYYYYYCYCY